MRPIDIRPKENTLGRRVNQTEVKHCSLDLPQTSVGWSQTTLLSQDP